MGVIAILSNEFDFGYLFAHGDAAVDIITALVLLNSSIVSSRRIYPLSVNLD